MSSLLASSALYLSSVAATLLQTDYVVQSPDIPALCMKPATGEWVLVNPANPSGPALGYGTIDLSGNMVKAEDAAFPELPDNLISWMQYVNDAQAFIAQNPGAAVSEEERLSLAPAEGVAPLMPHITWDQGNPYNSLVPKGCPTGCVATALSQIMYYYQYPEQGYGSHSYVWKGETMSVNFAEQTYDWSLMFDSYDRNVHTEEQIAEVAKLNYHVGVAMDMMYSSEGSGAYDMRVNENMRDYFGYSKQATLLNRFAFGLEAWTSALKRELSLGHPVYMSGSSTSGGHAFIIDGVNTDGYYHVNWGWGGHYNGWFDISIMKPEGIGTGASPSDDGFAWNQAIYVGFTPDVPADSIFYTTLQDYSLQVGSQNDTIYADLWMINTSATTQKGTVYFDLMQGEELIDRQVALDDDEYRYWKGKGGLTEYVLPQELADGEYCINLSFQNRDGFWSSIHGYRPTADCIKVLKQDGQVKAWLDDMGVIMTALEWNIGELYAGKEHKISALVRNDGQETVAGLWYLRLTPEEGDVQEIEAKTIVTLAPQESKWIDFLATIESQGKCLAQIGLFRQSEDDYTIWEVQASDTLLNVLDDGTFSADIALSDVPYLYGGDCEVNGTITIAAPIQNNAEPYVGDLAVKVFNDKNLTTELMSASTPFEMESQENTTALLPIKLEKAKAKRSYYAAVFMRKGNKYVKIPGEGNSIKLIVKEEGHAAGIETIHDDSERQAIRRDLLGRPIHNDAQHGFGIVGGKVIMMH